MKFAISLNKSNFINCVQVTLWYSEVRVYCFEGAVMDPGDERTENRGQVKEEGLRSIESCRVRVDSLRSPYERHQGKETLPKTSGSKCSTLR